MVAHSFEVDCFDSCIVLDAGHLLCGPKDPTIKQSYFETLEADLKQRFDKRGQSELLQILNKGMPLKIKVLTFSFLQVFLFQL